MLEGKASPGDAAVIAGRASHMRLIVRMIADRTQILFTPAPLPESSAGRRLAYAFAVALRNKAIHTAGIRGVCLGQAGCTVA